jgi:integrase
VVINISGGSTICIANGQVVVHTREMHPSPTVREGKDAAPQSPVAGRIEATPVELSESVSRWLEDMRRRNKKPRSIAAFREVVERAAKDNGWTTPIDLTFDAVTAYLGSKRDAGTWKGTTYNRNLTIFRSLTNFMHASGKLSDDPLVKAYRAESDGGEGSRAATIDEARAIVLSAWARAIDARSKGNRALYGCCLFGAGLRLGEPAQWKWKHIALDHSTPHILWTQDISKNHRRRDTALSPELVELLRAHREVVPHGPDDPVFPIVPSPSMFRQDAKRAGVPAEDYRGRPFSPHSARKFFSTMATSVGIPEKMVDFLMRHAGRVEHRYYQPSLEDQAEALKKLPRIWPPQVPPGHGPTSKRRIETKKRLDSKHEIADTESAIRASPCSENLPCSEALIRLLESLQRGGKEPRAPAAPRASGRATELSQAFGSSHEIGISVG